jgi:hypothetical protein
MAAGPILEAAWHRASGVMGELSLVITTRRPVNKPTILRWITRLRAAADELEKLLQEK